MKKFTFLSLLFFGILLHAQCTINGKSTINLNTEEIYSVANETAQCKDCHLWVGVGSSASISGDNRQSSVKLKANTAGRQVLSVAILTQQGLMQCSKNIDIIGRNRLIFTVGQIVASFGSRGRGFFYNKIRTLYFKRIIR